jgi:hypothetical protein
MIPLTFILSPQGRGQGEGLYSVIYALYTFTAHFL